MEPYCADITSEEVRTLEELLKPPEDEAEHYKVETLSRTVREQEGSEVPLNRRQQSPHDLLSSFPASLPAVLPLQTLRLSLPLLPPPQHLSAKSSCLLVFILRASGHAPCF